MLYTIMMFVVGGMLALLMAAILLAVIGNLRAGQAFRRRLVERLAGLRLNKALGRFGVEPEVFLHTRPVTDIQDQMKACGGCEELVRCDDALRKQLPPEEFSFCPNYDALSQMKDEAQTATASR